MVTVSVLSFCSSCPCVPGIRSGCDQAGHTQSTETPVYSCHSSLSPESTKEGVLCLHPLTSVSYLLFFRHVSLSWSGLLTCVCHCRFFPLLFNLIYESYILEGDPLGSFTLFSHKDILPGNPNMMLSITGSCKPICNVVRRV